MELSESFIPQEHCPSISPNQESEHSSLPPHFKSRQAVESIGISPSRRPKGGTSLSDDKTRDVVSQNITLSPPYNKKNRKETENSNFVSLRQESELLNSCSSSKMEELKSSEKTKWEQVIELVNNNLKGTIGGDKTKQMMAAILDFSVRNREELNRFSPKHIANIEESDPN